MPFGTGRELPRGWTSTFSSEHALSSPIVGRGRLSTFTRRPCRAYCTISPYFRFDICVMLQFPRCLRAIYPLHPIVSCAICCYSLVTSSVSFSFHDLFTYGSGWELRQLMQRSDDDLAWEQICYIWLRMTQSLPSRLRRQTPKNRQRNTRLYGIRGAPYRAPWGLSDQGTVYGVQLLHRYVIGYG